MQKNTFNPSTHITMVTSYLTGDLSNSRDNIVSNENIDVTGHFFINTPVIKIHFFPMIDTRSAVIVHVLCYYHGTRRVGVATNVGDRKLYTRKMQMSHMHGTSRRERPTTKRYVVARGEVEGAACVRC